MYLAKIAEAEGVPLSHTLNLIVPSLYSPLPPAMTVDFPSHPWNPEALPDLPVEDLRRSLSQLAYMVRLQGSEPNEHVLSDEMHWLESVPSDDKVEALAAWDTDQSELRDGDISDAATLDGLWKHMEAVSLADSWSRQDHDELEVCLFPSVSYWCDSLWHGV